MKWCLTTSDLIFENKFVLGDKVWSKGLWPMWWIFMLSTTRIRSTNETFGNLFKPNQLGPNYICVILSHRRITITSVWYYVSRLLGTLFGTSFKQRYALFCSCNSVFICSKNPFTSIFGANIFSYFFAIQNMENV